jgi:hypothetical protein
LERVALAAAQPLREIPIGAAAREREANDRARREAIIEPGRAARRARGKIVAAHHREIACAAIAGAIACAPHAPALLEAWRLRRLFQYLCISERNVVGQLFALGRKADRGATERVAAHVDEGIEHHVEELVGELEADLLRAGGGLAGEPIERPGQIAAGEEIKRFKGRRQRATIVEGVVNRCADVELSGGEARQWRRRLPRRRRLPQRRRQRQPRYRREPRRRRQRLPRLRWRRHWGERAAP